MWYIILMFAFTEYIPDVLLRYKCGRVFLLFLYANVFCNMMVTVWTMYYKVHKELAQKYRIYKFQKRRGRVLAHNSLIKRVGRDARVDRWLKRDPLDIPAEEQEPIEDYNKGILEVVSHRSQQSADKVDPMKHRKNAKAEFFAKMKKYREEDRKLEEPLDMMDPGKMYEEEKVPNSEGKFGPTI